MIEQADTSLQRITVQLSDVDKMLDHYDSGMFDVSTSNAVALALKRRLRPGYQVQVNRDPINHGCSAQIDDFRTQLPIGLIDWLESAECASPVEPISFWVHLPNEGLVSVAEKSQQPGKSEGLTLVA